MARAFSGFPVCPASPRDLVNIDAARIHTGQIEKEVNLASSWGDRHRATQDWKLLQAMGFSDPSRPKLARPATASSPRFPSSSTQTRMTMGWMLSNDEYEQMVAGIKERRERQQQELSRVLVHRPMMTSPRMPMPHFYGNSLHGHSKTGTDPRAT